MHSDSRPHHAHPLQRLLGLLAAICVVGLVVPEHAAAAELIRPAPAERTLLSARSVDPVHPFDQRHDRSMQVGAAAGRSVRPAPSAEAGDAAPDPTATTTTMPPPPSPVEVVLAEARRQLGVPYRWGGTSPSSGFDCSGFTGWVWSAAGVSLPHNSGAQYGATRQVPISDMAPGDLVFFGSPIRHVGLYVGWGQMIHSPRTGDAVRYADVLRSDLVGVGRIG